MAAITFLFTVRDTSLATGDNRITGLVPTWVALRLLSDNSAVTPQPAFNEVGNGQYKFSYDPQVQGEAAGQIDAGASVPNGSDRYIDVMLTEESQALLQQLDTIQAKTDTIPTGGPGSAGDLAAVATDVDTLLDRLGPFSGSGANTALGHLQALARSNATLPSDIGGTFNPATDSLEALRDRGDAAWSSDALMDDLLAGHTTPGTVGEAFNSLPTELLGLAGPFEHTHTVYAPGGVTPLPGVEVRVSRTAAGDDKSTPQLSDHLGRTVWRFSSAGTVYFWHFKSGYTFSGDPDAEVVS